MTCGNILQDEQPIAMRVPNGHAQLFGLAQKPQFCAAATN
jgi:hypothetical protein